VFETSVYLINYMPTFMLQNKSTFECLFHHTLDYSFLRTLRCLCFPFLRPYNVYKLDFRSILYVFLGYNSSHLGYNCLNHLKKITFIVMEDLMDIFFNLTTLAI